MRVLVTGAAGYIGSVVTQQLLETGHNVLALDDLRHPGRARAAPPGRSGAPGRRRTTVRQELGWEPRYPDLTRMVQTAWQWRQQHRHGYRQ